MPEVKYCDFNSIQQKQINTRSKLFYNLNPENDVFTMTLKYGIGTKKMPKLEYAVALMNNAGMLPDIEPLAFKRAMGELNANCTYAVDDNYMYVMMSGYEKDLVKACQLLSKQRFIRFSFFVWTGSGFFVRLVMQGGECVFDTSYQRIVAS